MLERPTLRVIPLGGLGEIGRNMTVFEHAGRLLIVDCGVLFPETDQPGVDLILPDFTYLRDRWDGWSRQPFTSQSSQQVSVWEKPGPLGYKAQ